MGWKGKFLLFLSILDTFSVNDKDLWTDYTMATQAYPHRSGLLPQLFGFSCLLFFFSPKWALQINNLV